MFPRPNTFRFILTSAMFCAAQAVTASPAGHIALLADEFYMARAQYDPLNYASANGDSRFDDQIGMSISPQVRADYFAHMHRLQKQLSKIPLSGLSAAERLNETILAFELDSAVNLEPYPEHLLPLTQMDNVPSTLANYAGGTGSQPLKTPMQYRAYWQRLKQLPGWIDQAIANMREGMRKGIVLPKTLTISMAPQFEQMLSTTPEANIFFTPINNMPPSFSEEDRERLTAA